MNVPNLYNYDGSPWWHGSPPYDGPAGVVVTHPFSCLLYDADRDMPKTADYIWALPVDLSDMSLPSDALAVLVSTLDTGGTIALHGVTPEHVDEGRRALLCLAGGGHA